MNIKDINLESVVKDLIQGVEDDIRVEEKETQESYIEPVVSPLSEDNRIKDPFHDLGLNNRRQVKIPPRVLTKPEVFGKSIKSNSKVVPQDTFLEVFLKKNNTLKRGRGDYNR